MKKEKKLEELTLAELRGYRIPKSLLVDDYPWPACPTCGARGHRDYARHCSECGQRLRWSKTYKKEVK